MNLGGARRVGMELASLLTTGDRGVLATVVRTNGSTYRKAGAQMLVKMDGRTVGILSGGCLEDQIAKEAMQALAQGRPRVAFFDLMPSEEYLVGYGKGCYGQLWVLLEPVTPEMPAATRALLAELSDVTRPTGVAIVYESEGEGALPVGTRVLVDVEHVVATNASVEAAGELAARVADGLAAGQAHHGELMNGAGVSRYGVHYLQPATELLLFGAAPDAMPLCAMGAQLGWDVRVHDHRPAYLREDAFPDACSLLRFDPEAMAAMKCVVRPHSAVVVMTHNLIVDSRILAWAARQPLIRYIGLLGPAHRRDRVLALLADEDAGETENLLVGRLHAPIGLDLGGADECAIALAVAAEIQKVRAGRSGRSRSSQPGPPA